MSKTTDYKVQWTPELREAVDNRIIEYLLQGHSQQEAEEKALQDLLDHTTFILPEVTVTAQAPVLKQVATESDWDPGYTKFMSGKRYYADQDHKNYLDWQRNDYTRGIREATDKWGNAIGTGVEIASGFTPLWWVAPAVRTGLDLSEGDYKGAALNAGLAFAAPYAVGKVFQYGDDLYSGYKTMTNPKEMYTPMAEALAPVKTSSASVSPTTNVKLTSHLQGDDAAQMFNEYAKGYTLPTTETENVRLLRAYVAEARERYGLVGNDKVSDETILKALYKHVDELGGNTAARNIDGEPQLLFRGDTKPYTTLRTNHAEAGGTPDNILGTLFLGELPHSLGDFGVYRYLVRGTDFRGSPQVLGAGAGSEARPIINNKVLKLAETEGRKGEVVFSFPEGTRKVIEYPNKLYNVYKLPASSSSTGSNDVNAFVVRTPAVRDITNEVVVAAGANPGTPPKLDWLLPIEDRIGKSLPEVWKGQNTRVVQEAQRANQGLLKSNKGSYWRGDEHAAYDYFALPDANVQNAKHILPYDFRIPRNWSDPNIFRIVAPTALTLGGAGTAAYNIYNSQPLYQKQGGSIHIKKKNRGKFTDYCGGKVTEECIRKGKNSSNPTTRKRANFAANARKWKHLEGGNINYLNYFN